MEDASLSDFLDAESESSDADTRSSEVDESPAAPPAEETASEPADGPDSEPESGSNVDAGEGPPVDAAAVDPAAVTASWRPAGGQCGACGASAAWRWRAADGELVCPDCASWDRV